MSIYNDFLKEAGEKLESEDYVEIFAIPGEVVTLEKSLKGSDEWWVHGIAGTAFAEDDFQEDIMPFLDPSRVNDRYLKGAHGKYTFMHTNHPQFSPKRVIGKTMHCEFQDHGKYYVRGKLFKSNKLAQELKEELESNENEKQFGQSVEGVCIRNPRNPKEIRTAVFHNIAIDPSPVNMATTLSLLKAMGLSQFMGTNTQQLEFKIQQLEKSIQAIQAGRCQHFDKDNKFIMDEHGDRTTAALNHLVHCKNIPISEAMAMINRYYEKKGELS